jgi:hypothetical protein
MKRLLRFSLSVSSFGGTRRSRGRGLFEHEKSVVTGVKKVDRYRCVVKDN